MSTWIVEWTSHLDLPGISKKTHPRDIPFWIAMGYPYTVFGRLFFTVKRMSLFYSQKDIQEFTAFRHVNKDFPSTVFSDYEYTSFLHSFAHSD